MLKENLYWRLAHIDTKQGLWYDADGEFTGLIHKEFNFCANTELLMPFDPELVGWLSATRSLEELWNWFPMEDVLRLQDHGWYITAYRADDVREYKNHVIIKASTATVVYTHTYGIEHLNGYNSRSTASLL